MASVNDIDRGVLGDRLRLARTAARRTQEDAAQHLGVARTTIVAIEKGDRKVSIQELQRLAVFYESSCHSLLQSERPAIAFVPQFRRMGADESNEREAADAVKLLERLAAAYAELSRLVGRSARGTYPAIVRLRREQVVDQAEDAALALRTQIGLGLAPIPDLQAVLESELGFRIFVRGLPGRISGVFGFTDAAGPCVLLNAVHPFERRQMSLGHEVGHFMSTRDAIDITMDGEGGADPVAEKFATQFGVSLLMPAAAIRRWFDDIVAADGKFSARHIIYLSQMFHVSREGMTRRLEALRLVPKGTWDALRRDVFGRREAPESSSDSTVASAAVRPSRLSLLAAEALERGLVTEGQLVTMLGLDRVVIRGMIDELENSDGGDQSDA